MTETKRQTDRSMCRLNETIKRRSKFHDHEIIPVHSQLVAGYDCCTMCSYWFFFFWFYAITNIYKTCNRLNEQKNQQQQYQSPLRFVYSGLLLFFLAAVVFVVGGTKSRVNMKSQFHARSFLIGATWLRRNHAH